MFQLPAGYPANARDAFALLNTRQRLSVDDLKVLALIELSGESAYFAFGEAVGNAEARALLERNGQEERGHAYRLVKALNLLDEPFTLPAAEDNPFYEVMKFDSIGAEMLGLLENGEMDGDLQYQKWADAEPNAEVAKLLRLNASEEGRHAERVAKVRELLQ